MYIIVGLDCPWWSWSLKIAHLFDANFFKPDFWLTESIINWLMKSCLNPRSYQCHEIRLPILVPISVGCFCFFFKILPTVVAKSCISNFGWFFNPTKILGCSNHRPFSTAGFRWPIHNIIINNLLNRHNCNGLSNPWRSKIITYLMEYPLVI